MAKRILAVIVAYNFERWIDPCLAGMRAQEGVAMDVLVVDNASTDGTIGRLRRDWPWVHVVEAGRNLGFGAANNVGLRRAVEEGYDGAFLINQDAWPMASDVVARLAVLADEYPEYGVLSPVHLARGGKLDRAFSEYVGVLERKSLPQAAEGVVECPFVNAACWYLPRRTLLAVGGFSPLFFHYSEDSDYAFRARFHGLKIGYAPALFCTHDREQRRSTLMDNRRYADANIMIQLSARVTFPLPLAMEKTTAFAAKRAWQCLRRKQPREALARLGMLLGMLPKSRALLAARRTARRRAPSFLGIDSRGANQLTE